MAKLYKVRKKCLICGSVFYPRYAGSLYCEDCKNRKKVETKIKPKTKKKDTKKKASKLIALMKKSQKKKKK
jgi:uncharacterized Zn finger protein (UPF0148 family)